VVVTLAEAISVDVLDALADRWPVEYAHYEAWKKWAPAFHAYGTWVEQFHLSRLPPEVQGDVRDKRWAKVTAYLKRRQAELDAAPTTEAAYDLRTLGAVVLRSGPVPWRGLVGFAALTDPPPSKDPTCRWDLPIDLARAPKDVQAVLRRVGRGE
jgi:hypothetical protein